MLARLARRLLFYSKASIEGAKVARYGYDWAGSEDVVAMVDVTILLRAHR